MRLNSLNIRSGILGRIHQVVTSSIGVLNLKQPFTDILQNILQISQISPKSNCVEVSF